MSFPRADAGQYVLLSPELVYRLSEFTVSSLEGQRHRMRGTESWNVRGMFARAADHEDVRIVGILHDRYKTIESSFRKLALEYRPLAYASIAIFVGQLSKLHTPVLVEISFDVGFRVTVLRYRRSVFGTEDKRRRAIEIQVVGAGRRDDTRHHL